MAKISTYPNIGTPSLSDKVIGTDTVNNDETKNFLISDIVSLIQSYGSFYSFVNQTATATNTPTEVLFDITRNNSTNGISIANNSSGNPTRITVTKTGIYKINYQLQVINSGGSHTVNSWIYLNPSGSLNASSSKLTLNNNAEHIITGTIILSLQANDYFNIMWQTNSLTAFLQATAPLVPSSTLDIYMIGT